MHVVNLTVRVFLGMYPIMRLHCWHYILLYKDILIIKQTKRVKAGDYGELHLTNHINFEV